MFISNLFYILKDKLLDLLHRSASNTHSCESHWPQSSSARSRRSFTILIHQQKQKSGFHRVIKPQTSFQSNIQPHDLNLINVGGAVCIFPLTDATGGFGAVFNGGLAVDTLQQLHFHPESCHICNIFHTYANCEREASKEQLPRDFSSKLSLCLQPSVWTEEMVS